jgi:eukaryotic-like serine/threonine-protein kinase
MTGSRWRQVTDIFHRALEHDAASRDAFLAGACAADPSLRADVDALLAAHEQAGSFGDTPLVTSIMRQLAAGTQVGPYRIDALIGAGGMGEVYRARDTRLHRDVALKVLPSALAGDPARLARFVQEARAASALEHPHIAVVHDFGSAEGVTYIVMELVRGQSLSDLVAHGPLTPARALDLGIEIAEGLARAHEIGLVHRDLKPANVMVTTDGHAKIIDFGLAKLIDVLSDDGATRSAHLTESGVVLGTASYMSPEQARGAVVDHRSDVFSFGILLYETLTGQPPFRRHSGVETMHAILCDPFPPLTLRSAIANDLQRLLEKCLAKEPADRYQDMRDLTVDLRTARRALDASDVRARPPVVTTRSARILAAASLAVVLAAAIGLWTFARRTRAETERQATVAQLEHLTDVGRFVEVWRVGRAAQYRWPHDPQIQQMLRAASQVVSLATEPPGADASFKAYDDLDGQWISIGTSPLSGVSVPMGLLRWRLTKAGFDPLEARLEVETDAAAMGHPDEKARPIRLRAINGEFAGMVFVPGDGPQGGAPLADYWIDQTEVTNRAFKAFIDRGGYEDQRYWTHVEGRREEIARQFVDRAGRPGPPNWELGTYPDGQADYPVSRVSWFEAVAYCQSVGKSLPTVAHWKKAFGGALFPEAVTLGNFGGRGPESTKRLKDVEPFGTSGMAGNVKEWVWNAVGDARYILGGGWSEPVYMAVMDEARPPLDRGEMNGFRCIKETTRSDAAVYAASARSTFRDLTKDQPVNDATFEILRRFYSYDRTPLDPKVEAVQEDERWRRERVSFAAAYGDERVLANILIPKNVRPPYQSVIWFPGVYAFDLKHSDGDLPFSYYFEFLPLNGRALVYPVYKGTHERSMRLELTKQLRDGGGAMVERPGPDD